MSTIIGFIALVIFAVVINHASDKAYKKGIKEGRRQALELIEDNSFAK